MPDTTYCCYFFFPYYYYHYYATTTTTTTIIATAITTTTTTTTTIITKTLLLLLLLLPPLYYYCYFFFHRYYHQNSHTSSGVISAIFSVDTRVLSPGLKWLQDRTNLHFVPGLRKSGAIPWLLLYAFVAWAGTTLPLLLLLKIIKIDLFIFNMLMHWPQGQLQRQQHRRVQQIHKTTNHEHNRWRLTIQQQFNIHGSVHHSMT